MELNCERRTKLHPGEERAKSKRKFGFSSFEPTDSGILGHWRGSRFGGPIAYLNSQVELAVRIWAATRRRERTLEQPATVFEAAVPARIRADERFQVALEDAETAESLERAMALHQANMRDWAAKGYTLLRAVEAADDAYERDVSKAFDVFRNSVRGNEEASDGG